MYQSHEIIHSDVVNCGDKLRKSRTFCLVVALAKTMKIKDQAFRHDEIPDEVNPNVTSVVQPHVESFNYAMGKGLQEVRVDHLDSNNIHYNCICVRFMP